MTEQTRDIWDEAMDAEWTPRPQAIFGQVQIDITTCVLVKGVGKVQFDPDQHNEDAKRHNVFFSILPLPGSGQRWATERNILVESKDWASVVKPSLRDLNTDLRHLNGQWAQAELVKTGTYVNKAGEDKDSTTIKFLAVYPTEAACQAAADAHASGHSPTAQPSAPPAPVAAPPKVAGLDREKAAKFLPALWRSSGENLEKMAELLQKNTAIGQYFDIGSPEVLAIIVPF